MTETSPVEASRYPAMISEYARLTVEIRDLEAVGQGLERILTLDRERVELHKALAAAARAIGKSPDDVLIDRIVEENTMVEYGINAPLIRLPARFYLPGTDRGIQLYEPGSPTRRINVVSTARKNEVDKVVDSTTYRSRGYSTHAIDPQTRNPAYWHNPDLHYNDPNINSLERRWETGDYFGLIYGIKSVYALVEQDIPESRHLAGFEAARALASDQGLLMVEIWERLGHEYDKSRLLIVEVPASRLLEVGTAISRNPDRYWLPKSPAKAN